MILGLAPFRGYQSWATFFFHRKYRQPGGVTKTFEKPFFWFYHWFGIGPPPGEGGRAAFWRWSLLFKFVTWFSIWGQRSWPWPWIRDLLFLTVRLIPHSTWSEHFLFFGTLFWRSHSSATIDSTQRLYTRTCFSLRVAIESQSSFNKIGRFILSL